MSETSIFFLKALMELESEENGKFSMTSEVISLGDIKYLINSSYHLNEDIHNAFMHINAGLMVKRGGVNV